MFNDLLELMAALSPWEASAVLLGIAYLLLATREHIACWICAFFSTLIYTVLFWESSLLMESALNVYYMAMAAYGWSQWRRRGEVGDGYSNSGGQDIGAELRISTWTTQRHLLVIGGVLVLAAASGALLGSYTEAAWPYLDSFTTWGAVVTTWMVAKKILENWIYWLVIDAISIPLYIDRGLHLTAVLFCAYLVIVVFGFFNWRREYMNYDRAKSPA